MTPKYRWIIAAFVLVCSCQVHAQTLSIKVIDESGSGVYSRVYYEEGTTPRPFWSTDQKGELRRPHACGKTRLLRASPFDRGTYFDSIEEPCAAKVTLRVVTKKTPTGFAVNYQITPVVLQDKTKAVIMLKTAIETSTSDAADFQCAVTLRTLAHQQLYKVEGDRWLPLKQITTPLSEAVEGAAQPDLQTVTFPYKCSATKERVLTLQESAADRLESLSAAMLKKNESLQSLGF